jgi:mono/diheme cytochrome c family protein
MRKSRSWLNPLLFLAVLGMTALCWYVPERDVTVPNYEFLPETQMAESPAYDSFAHNPNFTDGLTLRQPPAGTIARGHKAYHYQPTLDDALRAGQELANPFRPADPDYLVRRDRGTAVFTNYCQVCHGPLGQGNGPVTQGSFPPPASFLADRAMQMKDGQMFHVLTYGQQNMPPFRAQLTPDDRWSVILHIRMLQEPYAPEPGAPGMRSQAMVRLFRDNCAACHGEDGSGSNLRKVWPLIPDFTSLAWQMSQTELAIVNQIEFGSHPLMPAFRYKLPKEQILRLAVYVRSFAAHPGSVQVPVAASNLTATNIYATWCFACHETTGKGNKQIRAAMPQLPDFTDTAWQKTRTDQDFAQSILLGKGKFMPANADKLGAVDMKNLVTLVRGFEGGQQVIAIEDPKLPGPSAPPPPPSVAEGPSVVAKGPMLEAPTPEPTPGQPPKVAEPFVDRSAEEFAARVRTGAVIFRQYCIVCHGPDGTGKIIRASLPPIPDFTNPLFQKERSDAQLRVSILDGKGTLMPANRGRVTPNQAGDLVAFVRSFGPRELIQATPGVARPGSTPAGATSDFDKAYRDLERQMSELHKEMDKLKDRK